MTKFTFFVLFALASSFTYISASQSAKFGIPEKDQILLWAEHKQSSVYPEIGRKNLTHEFVFNGLDRNVERITVITYDFENVRFRFL